MSAVGELCMFQAYIQEQTILSLIVELISSIYHKCIHSHCSIN